MDMQYNGANCVRLSNKKSTIIIDDNLVDLGQKTVTKAGDVALFTGVHTAPTAEVKLVIDQPGEYEVSDISITGIAARSHLEEADKTDATIYKIVADDLRIVVLGHIYPELSDDQLEQLGLVDVLFVPVGGNGYTLDATGVLSLIRKISPKLVIPTHYADKSLKYPVPQATLTDALKDLSMEPRETVAKLKLKPAELSEITQLVVLERQ